MNLGSYATLQMQLPGAAAVKLTCFASDLTTLQDPWFIPMVQTSQGILGTIHPAPFLSTWENESWIAWGVWELRSRQFCGVRGQSL